MSELAFFLEGLVLLAATATFAYAIVWVAAWAARRLVHRWGGGAVTGAAVAFLLQGSIRAVNFCHTDPVCVPPTAEEAAAGSGGRMIFNSDGPMGGLAYLWLYVVAPVLLLTFTVLIRRQFLTVKARA